jgi:hypothetical protein
MKGKTRQKPAQSLKASLVGNHERKNAAKAGSKPESIASGKSRKEKRSEGQLKA